MTLCKPKRKSYGLIIPLIVETILMNGLGTELEIV